MRNHLLEIVTRRQNELQETFNHGFNQALKDVLEMIEDDASLGYIYENIYDVLNEMSKYHYNSVNPSDIKTKEDIFNQLPKNVEGYYQYTSKKDEKGEKRKNLLRNIWMGKNALTGLPLSGGKRTKIFNHELAHAFDLGGVSKLNPSNVAKISKEQEKKGYKKINPKSYAEAYNKAQNINRDNYTLRQKMMSKILPTKLFGDNYKDRHKVNPEIRARETSRYYNQIEGQRKRKEFVDNTKSKVKNVVKQLKSKL